MPTCIAVGIIGAGAVACGTAALLAQSGHRVRLWSPSGNGTAALAQGRPLKAQGAIEGEFAVQAASSAADLAAHARVIILALPAYAHRKMMDAVAPHLTRDHVVVISSHASLGALYLSLLLAERGVRLPIVAWGTTAVSGRLASPCSVKVNTVRSKIDLCTLPASDKERGLAACRELFGERFVERDGLLAIALSNLNPQNHMGIALCNMTRMELGETWDQGRHVTPNVGRLLEALDTERLAIAQALGLQVRTIFEHFHLSFHVPLGSVSDMNQEMSRLGRGGTGPASADSRYVTEDVPYGLVATARLGALTQRPAPLHEAGVAVFSAMYGRDFSDENALLRALDLDALSLAELKALSRNGYA
ncbi:NAD/NADP octopine/nopaline dehydrogenase family protein [Bordetella sp. FB-8]|uniref:NAD/NADP octopine/nopaline dehydrogenase family protein n=1 Tax=Bordetella sp. FB-8 TaxID=1159870 RepID=UPI0003674372|nr:NAD/NADP octopine/nopaline dehydrogenase family protein [Bordetella sp. FB-8]